ncbi:MAG: RHS repeat-associated core domain-containing protein [Phycisphaerae bacterium]|jgi:RHS repeat-associated protein
MKSIESGSGGAKPTAIAPSGSQGSRRAPEFGLTYFGARYYDPVTGRMISSDPNGTGLLVANALAMNARTQMAFISLCLHSEYTAGMNFYQFAGDNPVAGRDPNGAFSLLDTANSLFVRGYLQRIALSAGTRKSGPNARFCFLDTLQPLSSVRVRGVDQVADGQLRVPGFPPVAGRSDKTELRYAECRICVGKIERELHELPETYFFEHQPNAQSLVRRAREADRRLWIIPHPRIGRQTRRDHCLFDLCEQFVVGSCAFDGQSRGLSECLYPHGVLAHLPELRHLRAV